jgi:hypothetical protein
MQLQFKNQQIFFALESIWPNLDYRFKYHVNELVAANPSDDFVQAVNVPEEIIVQIFKAVSSQPEGVATVINQQMLTALQPQIEAASNIAAVMQGLEAPNEASRIIIAITEFSAANAATKKDKILNGKTQILQ